MAKKKIEIVKVRFLTSYVMADQPAFRPKDIANVPADVAERMFAAGEAEPVEAGAELKASILLVQAAGGEISCDKDNKAILDALSQIEADEAEAVARAEAEKKAKEEAEAKKKQEAEAAAKAEKDAKETPHEKTRKENAKAAVKE